MSMADRAIVPTGHLQVATPRSMALAIDGGTEATEAVDRRVKPAVADAVADNPELIDAAAERALDLHGIVMGAASTTAQGETAWAQTTTPGPDGTSRRLPLGYTADGHLDDFARKMFREDLDGARYITDAEWAHLWLTPSGQIILGVRWDGETIIPGLVTDGTSGGPSRAPLVFDAPYAPGTAWVPPAADATRVAGWGSSTMSGLSPHMQAVLAPHGVSWYGGGKSGERVEAHAARQGGVPATITFTGGQVPAGGASVALADAGGLDGWNPQALRAYTGRFTTPDGTTVTGELSYSDGAFRFARSGSGAALVVPGPVALIPDDGETERNSMLLLNAGKNSLTNTGAHNSDPAYVADVIMRMVEHQAALGKRVLVVGQWINTGTPAVSAVRDRLVECDRILAEKLGPDLFLDSSAWITSEDYWTDTGLTPTQDDLDQQALGNKPHSGGADNQHLDTVALRAYAHLIERRLVQLGWINDLGGN